MVKNLQEFAEDVGKTNVTLQSIDRKLKDVEAEQHGCSKMLKLQANRLDFKDKKQERLVNELKAAAVKIKELEDNAAVAKLAHIDCKSTIEIMQRELSILLNLYQSMANAHVLAKQTNVPLEQLPWTELCALLHENIEALILNFHKANERVSHLEYIFKHKTDTMNDLQKNQEDAFEKMSELLKAQEHCWQKEEQYLEEQYSNRLAEVHAKAQECEETVQKNKQKLYGLEQICQQLAHENNSMTNSLLDAFKARSSLLAACALLSGALRPLYGRLSAMSCQRDILQEQVNQHQLLNQKIIRLLYDLPTIVESNQDEGRLRHRRAKCLVYVFRRAVIAVLAANRLRALARYSCTFFVWTDGSRGSNGIQVCVGESRGSHNLQFCFTGFEEEGDDCDEAVGWLASSNLYTAIISSISELEGVLSKQGESLRRSPDRALDRESAPVLPAAAGRS
ncbi:coiled-coil domain-containing protein 171-like [Onychostruthus taczanowskii]|uniref:coiled-coil domain-containing protein 171-like n=1 Tax=Onychostruthus taczanowskii TaxID=356909 RepID=UPI001B7FF8BA|nr:coiled-coil domain-containing protein 171-like [Onychostruthus taczanowskii]